MIRPLIALVLPLAAFAAEGVPVKAGHGAAATASTTAAVPAFLTVRAPAAKALAASTAVSSAPVGELPWLRIRRQGGKLRG